MFYDIICETDTKKLGLLLITSSIYNIYINRWLTKEIGVAAIPLSAFYTDDRKHLAANYIRFCTCKLDSTIEEAGTRLLALNSYRNK